MPGFTNVKAGAIRLFAMRFPDRLAALRLVISLALLSGILLSLSLWFPLTRSFPRAPLVLDLPQNIFPAVEYLLSGLLVMALAALVFARRTTIYLIIAIVLLALLALSDQMRLQPWVYQYLLLLTVLALHSRQSVDEQSSGFGLSILQLIVAALYFWSGAQKLNYSFSHEVMPQLFASLQNYLPLSQMQFTALGICIGLVEILTGCGLLFKRTRRLCIYLALAMHGILLVLLVGQGRNHVVWAWNAALMLIVLILFWKSDVFIWKTFANRRAMGRAGDVALSLAIICAALPVLSFWGWWDMYLSGALYSGNTAVAAVRVDDQVFEKLPETAKRLVFTTKSSEKVLPVFEWAMSELNVPPYPEPRVFRQITREICKLSENESGVELIVKGRPAILDGSFNVIRMNCTQLRE